MKALLKKIDMRQLLEELIDKGISVVRENDNLKIKYNGEKLPADIVHKIKEHKEEILNYLKKRDLVQSRQVINNVAQSDTYPLSSAQKRLWMLYQIDGEGTAYNMPSKIFLDGEYDMDCFKQSINAVIDRHEILRTVFIMDDEDRVCQRILDRETLGFEIGYQDFRGEEARALAFIEADAYRPFDLEHGPLLRATLFQVAEQRYIFYYNMHHIISDGWSMGILVRDVMGYYEAFISGGTPALPELPIQYKDYAAWQLDQLKSPQAGDDRTYWLNMLSGELPLLDLPVYKARPKVMTYNGYHLSMYIAPSLTAALNNYCLEHGGSLFMGLLAVWNVLCYRYTSQEDIITGTPVAGREHYDLEDQIGFYINTLALRNRIDPNESFDTFFDRLKENTLKSFEHQQYPFDLLVEDLGVVYDTGRNAVFDAMLVFQNNRDKSINTAIVDTESDKITDLGSYKAMFDLDLDFSEIGNCLQLTVTYNTDVYDREMIEQLMLHYKHLLAALLKDTGERIGVVDYLPAAEKNQLLIGFNDTAAEYPEDKTVVDLFADQVEKGPDNIAVVYEGKELTYRQLDEHSNQLAHYLTGCGMKAGELVPVYMERSHELSIAVLAVLKAGGAYLPIDTKNPNDRINHMLEDSGARFILSTATLLSALELNGIEPLDIDQSGYQHLPADPVNVRPSAKDLAYLIYTSGSTGQPKGVMVGHSSLVSRLYYYQHYYELGKADSILFYSSFSFDAAIEEYLLPFAAGAKCVIAGPAFHNELFANIIDYIDRFKITKVTTPPVLMQNIIHELADDQVGKMASLRHIITGGEQASAETINSFYKKMKPLNGYTLYNAYGPTENTIDSTIYKLENKHHKRIPIGKPIDNSTAYVLDKYHQLNPVGVTGEIFLGGVGLSRGYLNRPELNAEKFIPHPYIKGERLYKTGDLGRWLADGNLEYSGRNDNQVKIRGYRIELGEIENALMDLEVISQAVVIVKHYDENVRLVAYVVPNGDFKKSDLQESLRARLPEYMVPGIFVELTAIPVTINGKVDVKQLPEPGEDDLLMETYEPAQTPVQQQIIDIWKSLLRQERIGINDSFFNLGGDSIIAIQMVSRARKAGITIKVNDLYRYHTIKELSKNLHQAVITISEQGVLEGEVPLLPIQQHFFDQQYQRPDHYNQSLLLTVPSNMEPDVINKAVALLLQQHDALRLRYVLKEDQYQGVYDTTIPGLIIEKAATEKEIGEICASYQQQISLETGDLSRFVLIETPSSDANNRLFVCIHHLGIDGVSWRILVEDLSAYLDLLHAGKEVTPEPKTTSYRQWQERLKTYADHPQLKNEVEYWNKILSKAEALPQDYEFAGSSVRKETEYQTVSLTTEETRNLLQDCNEAFGTEINDLLLCALSLSLTAIFNKNQFVIGLEGHGREELYDDTDVSKTIGWFTTLYPVLIESFPGDMESSLVQVKENLRSVPNKGIGYGILRYLSDSASIRKQLSKDIEQIVFNYLGQIGGETSGSAGILGMAGEYKGMEISEENQQESKLSVTGLVMNDCLTLSISYDKNRYAGETISKLGTLYKESIQQLIALCKNAGPATKTPTDYGVNGLISYRELKQFIAQHDVIDLYRLTALQEGMLFHSLFENDANSYVAQTSFDFHGDFHADAFIRAWEYVAEKHSILRTSFHIAPFEAPVQCVHEKISLPVHLLDYTDNEGDKPIDEKISEFLKIDARTPFNLGKAPLFRLAIIKTGPAVVKVVYTIHHIIADGWSTPVIFSECFSAYEQMVSEGHLPVPARIDNYKDYLTHIGQKDIYKTRSHWQEQLKQLDTASLLPFSNEKDRNKTFGNTARYFTKEGAYITRLETFARKNNLTVNTIVQGAWAYILSRYVNQRTVVFGTVISGRSTDMEDVESRVGMYINTIPLCTTLNDASTIVSWLTGLQQDQTISREEYGFASLADIQKQTSIKGELFDSLLVFENYPSDAIDAVKSKLDIDNIKVKQQNNYLLTISVNYYPEKKLNVTFEYNSTLLADDIINMMEGHFITVLETMLEEKQVEGLNLLTTAETEALIYTCNQTAAIVDPSLNVLSLFKDRVLQTPDAPALRYNGKSFSFATVDHLSNHVARHLQVSCGINKGNIVGIKLDRNEWEVIAVLGVLKAGAAYVPISPDTTLSRQEFILQDAGIKTLISSTSYLFDFNAYEGEIFAIDVELDADAPCEEISVPVDNTDLAYILFTSGSTGVPKGVMITHGSLANYLLWAMETYLGNDLANGNFGLFTTLSFDLTITSLFLPLISGNTLEIFEKEQVPKTLKKYLESPISCIKLTPAHISLLQELELTSVGAELAIVGGDALLKHHIDILRSLNPRMRIFNEYGPTEATVGCMIYEVPFNEEEISIGHPIANTEIYLLNEHGRLQPGHTIGEICVGGSGLAKGYLNKPELTAEKFAVHPFKTGARIYKTGDLGIRKSDGSLIYLGRKDNQVKIRGYRIELGEIEACLCAHEAVREAVVMTIDAGRKEKELIACVVTDSEMTINEMRAYLSKTLPEYMIPSRFVQLDSIPLTSNGKIDKETLLSTGNTGLASGVEYVAASTPVEEELVSIWQEHLEVERIGVKDDYFHLGGDSIKMIRLISKINKVFKIDLPIGIFYEKPTVEALAAFISGIEPGGQHADQEVLAGITAELEQLETSVLQAHPEPDTIDHVYPMSDIQIGMVLTSQIMMHAGDYGVYHDQFLFWLGTIDIPRLRKAMELMVDKHETFRTSYHLYAYEKQVQIVHKKIPVTIDYKDLSALPGQEKESYIREFLADERINNYFDPSKTPLWRITIFQIGAADTIFAFQFHHAIIDGWGQNNFKVELFQIYKALEQDEHYRPEALKCTIRDSVISDLIELKNESNKSFWENKLRDYKRLDIMSEQPLEREAVKVYPKDFSLRLTEKCKQDKISPKALFLSGYLYVLGLLSYENDLTVGVVTHKRPIVEDGDKILGCFLNSVPFRTDLAFSGGFSWKGFVHQIERELSELKARERVTLNNIVAFTGEEATMNPFFDVLFNYVNFHVINELFDDKDFVEQQSKREVEEFSVDGYERTNTFLNFTVSQTMDNVSLIVDQQRDLKSGRTLEDLIGFYDAFLHNYLERDEEVISGMGILPAEEKEKLFAFGNHHVAIPAPADDTLITMFEKQVQAHPGHPALKFGEKQYSYTALNQLANKFANFLHDQFDVAEGDLIAIQLERSEWVVVAILGILKTGAAYLPVDPDYPAERISYLKTDSRCRFCIDAATIAAFMEIRDTTSDSWQTVGSPDNVAYVIYTSGSTGNPKGVEIRHAGILNTMLGIIECFELNEGWKILQFASLSFDASVDEIFRALLSGGCLHMIDEKTRNTPDLLQQYLVSEQIDLALLPPAYLKMLDVQQLKGVSMLITAGESPDVDNVKEFLGNTAGAYANAYGPTEISICATVFKTNNTADIKKRNIPIGRPIRNVKMYVLDDHLQLAPMGVMGEIYIGGAGLAKGYLHRPELTAEKFIVHPFNEKERLYKTGDFGRWLPDGNMEFMGRKDEQVKIRGYRIELGEIESQLLLKPEIKEAVALVAANDQEEKELIIYFVSTAVEDEKALREKLAGKLPVYMLPDRYIQLKEIPVTPNGKTDRQKLLKMEGVISGAGDSYVAPKDDLEMKLVAIWEEVVKGRRIGITDSFFEIGGNSLKAMKLVTRIRKEFNVDVDILMLYHNPSIEQLKVQLENLLWVNVNMDKEEDELENFTF